MNLEDFQSLDNEPIDNSIIKRDFLKVYHQRGANLKDPDQNVQLLIGESINYHQIGNSYLEFGIAVRKADGNNFNVTNDPATKAVIRLINKGFAYRFKEARLGTTGGAVLEHCKNVGQISRNMRALTSKDRELLSHFDKINETEETINYSSIKHQLINNHTEAKLEVKDH